MTVTSIAQSGASVSLKVSSLGITLEGVKKITKVLNARAGISYFTFEYDAGDDTGEDFTYLGDLSLLSVSLLADYYPFENHFRISAGGLLNLNEGDLTLTPLKTYTIGGSIYTPEELGTVSAKVKMNMFSPYLGIGYGNEAVGRGVSFSFDIGAIYQGNPEVDMSAVGYLEPSAEQDYIIEDNLSWFKWYPVVSIGISYSF
jgi:hypothetical protein